MRCRYREEEALREYATGDVPMGRFAAILLAVTGTVALQVVAQAVVLASVRFIGHRTRSAGELRRTFWISLGAVLPLFFGHFAQVGLWAGFLVWLGALKTYGRNVPSGWCSTSQNRIQCSSRRAINTTAQ